MTMADLFFDQLQIDHLGGVPMPRPELDDTRVAAGTCGIARRDLIEKLLDDLGIVEAGGGQAAGRNRPRLPRGAPPPGARARGERGGGGAPGGEPIPPATPRRRRRPWPARSGVPLRRSWRRLWSWSS